MRGDIKLIMKKIIVGNWKMNPETLEEAQDIAKEIKKIASKLKKIETVICPPSIYISNLKSKISNLPVDEAGLKLGAQDVSAEFDTGSYTGEISAGMLKNIGVKYVIIGHSERRAMGETDEIINKKIKTALKAGLKVIFCAGEKERDDEEHFLDFIKKEIEGGLHGVEKKFFRNIIIVYEPVWAISSGKKFRPDNPDSVFKITIFIKKTLMPLVENGALRSIPILYGGSVTALTAREFLEKGGIQGLLVGGKSLIPKEFSQILEIADRL